MVWYAPRLLKEGSSILACNPLAPTGSLEVPSPVEPVSSVGMHAMVSEGVAGADVSRASACGCPWVRVCAQSPWSLKGADPLPWPPPGDLSSSSTSCTNSSCRAAVPRRVTRLVTPAAQVELDAVGFVVVDAGAGRVSGFGGAGTGSGGEEGCATASACGMVQSSVSG
jgi:hypothetical protein